MGENESASDDKPRGVDVVVRYLHDAGVPHELLEHRPTYSAAEDAEATGTAPAEEAKTILLRSGQRYRVAVLPASRRLDVRKLRDLLGETSQLRLATEPEIGEDFPEFDVGAAPPFGLTGATAEVVDQRLLDCDRIVCAAGDHRHSVKLDPRDLIRVADARVADICED